MTTCKKIEVQISKVSIQTLGENFQVCLAIEKKIDQ